MALFDSLDGRTQLLIVTTLGVMVTALAAVVGMAVVWLLQRLALKVRGRE
jgi:energy-coupling factor transporter transmembrane protein EcfT